MITVLFASAINVAALQASIAAPTDAFRGCLREAVSKAKNEKVSGTAIEDYLKNACTVQMGTLKDALVAFRIKNGMTKKAALGDAEMTVDDYVATPSDNYRFMAEQDAPKPAPAAQATPPATPAAAQAATTPPH